MGKKHNLGLLHTMLGRPLNKGVNGDTTVCQGPCNVGKHTGLIENPQPNVKTCLAVGDWKDGKVLKMLGLEGQHRNRGCLTRTCIKPCKVDKIGNDRAGRWL